jgi:hypothetical protein
VSNSFHKSALRAVACAVTVLAHAGLSQPAKAEERIEARRSVFHVGQSVLACGTVAQISDRAEVTYINLDAAYPRQTLGLVIWRTDLAAYEARFGSLSSLLNKRVCARGTIEQYRSSLQMVLRNAQFLRLMAP